MKNQKDIVFILIVLLLLSASMGFLHGRKKSIDSNVVADDVRVILEHQDAIDYIQPFLMSGNIDLAVEAIDQFDKCLFEKIFDTIFSNQTIQLTKEQKIQLLAASLLHTQDLARQQKILKYMERYFNDYPIFIGMVDGYEKAISYLLSRGDKPQLQKQIKNWIDISIKKAIELDDVDIFAKLFTLGIPKNEVNASLLLYKVAQERKNPLFAYFLVEKLRANVDFSPDEKKTSLMQAVENNDEAMVQALIKLGANPGLILDTGIGNASQMAFERGYTQIESFLKKNAKL